MFNRGFNMNMHEARLRLEVNRMGMSRIDGEYRVYFPEIKDRKEQEKSAYYTDDLEDAVLTAGAMRRSRPMLVAA